MIETSITFMMLGIFIGVFVHMVYSSLFGKSSKNKANKSKAKDSDGEENEWESEESSEEDESGFKRNGGV